MTRETTRRGFVAGLAGGGAVGAASAPAGAQETETDDDGTASGGGTADGTAMGDGGTATGGGTAGGTADGDETAGGGTAGGGDGGGGQPDFGTFFEGVDNYTGDVVDLRGEGQPEVQVGTQANGGAFGFGPAAVHVENGATVTWTWTGEGCPHNVVADDDTFDSGEPGCEETSPFEFTFEEDGIYPYVCEPHEQLGMKGAVVVGTDYPTVDTGGGTVVGVGTGRVAVAIPGSAREGESEPADRDPLVAKLARYGPSAEMGDGRPQNRRERRIWSAVESHPFLPVLDAGPGGDWIAMPRADVPPDESVREEALDRVRAALAPHRDRFHFDELKPENVGAYRDRYWIVDYGRPAGDPLFVDPPGESEPSEADAAGADPNASENRQDRSYEN